MKRILPVASSLILILFFVSISSFTYAFNFKFFQTRTTVPVTITASNNDWVETISICNTSSTPIPLTDIELDFTYSPTMPTNIWGQPYAYWRVASQSAGSVVLLGGAPYTLPTDSGCNNPVTIQFNAPPNSPAPTNFIFKAVMPTSTVGNLNVNVPTAPATGLSNPNITVTGGGQTLQKVVNWGTQWALTNLATGSYTVTSSSVSNGTVTYIANPVTVNVTAGTTAQVTMQYTQQSSVGNLTITMPAAPVSGLSNPTVTVTGPGGSQQKIVNWGTQWALTGLATGSYTVSSSTVSSGSTTYTAAPITTTVTTGTTAQVTIQYTQSSTTQVSNGAWVYDSTYDSSGNRTGVQPGLFSSNINSYNSMAGTGHKLTQLFSYGGDMEMYCRGSGGSSTSTACTSSNMQAYYNAQSTKAYYDAAKNTANPVQMYPILDGVVGGAYLTVFNSMTQTEAATYADNVAKVYCADDSVYGVSFDLEPLDISQPGQAYFYAQIAKDFAGQHTPGQPDPYQCVDTAHPKGRTFSVFGNSSDINAKMGEIFNLYGNGFYIGSLYDLGSNQGGVVNSVSNYTTYVNSEVAKTMTNAKTYNVKYQFGIPAAASVHEFESIDGSSTGYKQIDYVTAAINAINSKNVRQDPLFMGINLWGWNQRMFWNGHEFTPAIPNATVLNYLGTAL